MKGEIAFIDDKMQKGIYVLDEDFRQIKRWKAMRRHVGAIRKNCPIGMLEYRKKQRQALLH